MGYLARMPLNLTFYLSFNTSQNWSLMAELQKKEQERGVKSFDSTSNMYLTISRSLLFTVQFLMWKGEARWPHGECARLRDRAVRVRALAWDIVLCFWARHFTLTVPLSTKVYKWVPANLMLGGNLRWTSIPSRGSRNTPSRFMLQKPR